MATLPCCHPLFRRPALPSSPLTCCTSPSPTLSYTSPRPSPHLTMNHHYWTVSGIAHLFTQTIFQSPNV